MSKILGETAYKAAVKQTMDKLKPLRDVILNDIKKRKRREKVNQTIKKRNFIYLAGNISEDIRTYEWREEFIEYLKDEANIVIVNPCANAFNQAMKNAASGGLEFTRKAKARSQRILRPKDYQLVKMCNAIVVNLALASPEKPMVGTIQELTWAHDIFYVPVIAITEGVENIYTLHPWIDECCAAKVETVEDASEMIKTFLLEY